MHPGPAGRATQPRSKNSNQSTAGNLIQPRPPLNLGPLDLGRLNRGGSIDAIDAIDAIDDSGS